MTIVKKNIFIVDDHSIVRQGLRKLIELEEDLVVCGEAGSASEAVRLIADAGPDLVIVDISLDNDSSGIGLVKALKDRFPGTRSLVLTMHDEALYAERSLRAGARGYVMKKQAHADIITAIRTILKGDIYLSGDISARIIDRMFLGTDRGLVPPMEQLSDRELEILYLIGNGFRTGEIAAKLGISINTI